MDSVVNPTVRVKYREYQIFYILFYCSLFEATRIEGKLEGRALEIIETGIEFGLSKENILERLQKKLNISLQEAKEYLKMFGKENS